MQTRFTRILAAAGSLLAAGAITATGVSAASAAPGVPAAPSGTEHLQLVSSSATANTAPVIAYGLFTAGGTDHMGNTVDKFVFSGGSFKVWHSNGTGTPHFNTKTCLLTATIRGTLKIYGGTGKYAGIKGHGTYVFTWLAIAKRKANGSCNTAQNALPAAVEQIIKGTASVKL